MVDTSRGGRAILNLIIYLPLVFSSDCGIDFGNDSPFAFNEIKEDTSVGTSLGNFSATNIIAWSLSPPLESTFISVRQNEDKTRIDFILSRPLTEYRTAAWSPSIEVDVTVNCTVFESGNGGEGGYLGLVTSVKNKTYKFMSLIEDCNLYAPTFNPSLTEFNFTYPWATNSPLNKDAIKISDFDYNRAHANLTIDCVSTDCQYFDIKTNLTSSNDKGHNYEIFVYPKEDIKVLPKMKEGTRFSLNITASDEIHESSMTISFVTAKIVNTQQESDSPFPKTIVGIIGGGLGIICAVLGGAWGYTWYRGGSAKRVLEKLTETEIREFMEGTVIGYGEWMGKRSIDVNMPIIARPYNKAVDIPRDSLRIDETSVLGTGFFGVVMKGQITHPNGDTSIVAVKKVKRNVGLVYFKALLSELKIMAHLGNHPNIVKLVGACTHNIRKREVFIAVEFCANGNLHNFLIKSRGNFISMVQNGQLCGVPDNENSNAELEKTNDSYSPAVSTLDLLKWCFQIASGLEYLGSLGVIHGDLATRNILLDSENVAKIADFGLSRRLVDASNYYYTKQSQAIEVPRPWKWMAPETLTDMKFSTQSDIWSFGVVLWEIFTMGQIPYPTVQWSDNFVRHLEEGVRLGQPAYASDSIYDIMQDCWTEEPTDRPVAHDIKRIFGDLISKLLKQTEDDDYMKVIGDEKPLYIGDLGRAQKLMSQDQDSQDSQYHSEIDEC